MRSALRFITILLAEYCPQVTATAALFLWIGIQPAAPQAGFRVPALDEYCRLAPVTWRETVVYLDGASLAGKPERILEFASTIVKKIGLAPRERVRIVYVRGNEGIKEIFNKCWPDFTADETAAHHAPSSSWLETIRKWFDESPDQALQDTKDFFRLGIQDAISKEVEVGNTLKTDMARALSADKNRLSGNGKVYRILIYSGMESNTLSAAFSAPPPNLDEHERLETLFREHPLALNGAETFIWGVTDSQTVSLRSIERIWTAYLQRGLSNLKSFGPELPIQESAIYHQPVTYSGSWKSHRDSGRASITLSSSKNGTLVSSWISLQAALPYSVPIDGVYECRPEGQCSIRAKISKNVPYLRKGPPFEEGDTIELSGTLTSLKGTIRPPSKTVFRPQTPGSGNTPGIFVEYALDVAKQ